MDLLYIHQYFKLPRESGGTRSYDLAKGFIERGFKVTILSSIQDAEFKGKGWVKNEVDNLTIYYLYVPYNNSLNFYERILSFIKFAYKLFFKLFSFKPSLILVSSTPLTVGLPVLLHRLFLKRRYIFEVRDVWPEAAIAIGEIKSKLLISMLIKIEYILYYFAENIVVLSIDMRNSIVSRFARFESRINVIENICEIDRFQSSESNVNLKNYFGFDPRFSVLYAGSFGKVNGLRYCLLLAKEVLQIDNSICFILMGSGSQKDLLLHEAAELGVLGRNVIFVNQVGKSELPSWYRSCSMGSSFVINIRELWNNSANKFFDTLAAGRPILINYGGWQSDKISNCDLGYVFPPVLTRDDAMSFVKYTRNSVKVDEQGRNSLLVAEKDYSLELAIQKYIVLFQNFKKF